MRDVRVKQVIQTLGIFLRIFSPDADERIAQILNIAACIAIVHMIASQLIILDRLPVSLILIADQLLFRARRIDHRVVVLKHRPYNAFHAGIVFAIRRVLPGALVPKAAMNDAVAEKQQMPGIDTAVPVILRGKPGAGAILPAMVMVFGQNIALGRSGFFRIHPVIEQVNGNAIRVSDSVRNDMPLQNIRANASGRLKQSRPQLLFLRSLILARCARLCIRKFGSRRITACFIMHMLASEHFYDAAALLCADMFLRLLLLSLKDAVLFQGVTLLRMFMPTGTLLRLFCVYYSRKYGE